ncbi:hypothetical protein F4604DRAFT_1932829 [Suillus subluteus]|nr:hypothetical protein F4604DRAFT_1932829 [Suillus subluteus]
MKRHELGPYVPADVPVSTTNSIDPLLIVPPGTKLNLQPLDNPYAAAMGQIPLALPPSTAPSPAISVQLESRFLNASQHTYQPAAPTTLPEHFIDPVLWTQVSSVGASASRFLNTPQYVDQSFVQPQVAVLQRLPKPAAGLALQTKNCLSTSDKSDPEDSRNSKGDESSASDNTEEEDEVANRATDIGNWGASGGCYTSHPGDLYEPPQPPQNPCPLMPKFECEYPCNEGKGNAAAALASMQPKQNVQYLCDKGNATTNLTSAQPKQTNVLKQHQKKNGRHYLPDPGHLEILHQQSEINVQHEALPSRSEVKPTQLGWYKSGWKSFLEEAKGECYTVHTLDNLFLNLIEDLPHSITEVLMSLKTKWERIEKQVKSSVWPAQQSNMARLLYDDLATWQSELKKVVISLVLRMLDLVPPAEFNCVLLGLSKNGSSKTFPKFTAKEYEPIYNEMMEMIQLILKDRYHGPKLIKQLEEWAAYGWSQSLNIDGCGFQAKPNHMKVVLN